MFIFDIDTLLARGCFGQKTGRGPKKQEKKFVTPTLLLVVIKGKITQNFFKILTEHYKIFWKKKFEKMCRFIYQNVQNSILRIFLNEDGLHDLSKKIFFEKKIFLKIK